MDHDHKRGLFRGWICRSCNLNEGSANKDPESYIAVAHYVDAWKARMTEEHPLPDETPSPVQVLSSTR